MTVPTQPTPSSSEQFLISAFSFEGGLAVVAMVVGWLLGRDPFLGLEIAREAWGQNVAAMGWGAVSALPLLLFFWLADRYPLGGLKQVKEVVERQMLPQFGQATLVEIGLICVAAGFGEELLFRGLIQGTLTEQLGGPYPQWLALVLASVAFGLCHWLTHLYAILAFVMGLFFGVLAMTTNNILAPITCHAIYDFIALWWLLQQNKKPATGLASGRR